MVELKLARLPDRTPVKYAFSAPPELDVSLRQYAGLYRAAYGEAASVDEMIPFMLEAFLNSDRAFAKARKDGALEEPEEPPAARRGRPKAEPPEPAGALTKSED
jgi:hypothetical protein